MKVDRSLMRYSRSAAFALLCIPMMASAQLSLVHSFDITDGSRPNAPVIQGADGLIYGVTEFGGILPSGTCNNCSNNGGGVVFKLGTDGSNYTLLHEFDETTDGGLPESALLKGSDGNYYGTTGLNPGALFSISPSGTFQQLYKLNGAQDGTYVDSALVDGGDGYLYGAAPYGGAGAGTVYRITTAGAFTVLYTLPSTSGQFNGVSFGSDGYLYGTSQHGSGNSGAVYRFARDGSGYTVLHQFNGTDGTDPRGALVQAADGNFYGVTQSGGQNGYGTIYKITAGGAFSSLYSFSWNDGNAPLDGLIADPYGNLYGTTSDGGANDYGTAFKITYTGSLTTLYNFAAGANAAASVPESALLLASDGYLYGTTVQGGAYGYGSIFKLLPPPGITLTASPASVLAGQTTTLTWSSTGSTCSASGSWSGSVGTTGTQVVNVPAVGSNNYTLTCTNAAGSSVQTSVVTGLSPAPQVSIAASPTSQVIDNPVTLSWTSSNATACTAGGAWSGTVATSGTQSVKIPLAGLNSYTINCNGPGGTGAQSVSVTGTLPTVAFSASSESATAGLFGSASASISVKLSTALQRAVSVSYVLGGSEPSSSYTTSPLGAITFAPGTTSATLSVLASSVQCNKNIVFTLSSPTNATIGAIGTNTLTLKALLFCN